MRTSIHPKTYVYVFITILFALPFLVNYISPKTFLVLFVDVFLFVLVYYRCSRPDLSFIDGLTLISGSLMSGCANLTIIYIFPLLFLVYAVCVVVTGLGLLLGKTYTENSFLAVVQRFYRR